MELLLIRHALPLRRELESGAADPHLSPVGHEQSKALAVYLASESFDAIYSSPMNRAAQTADPLSSVTGLLPVLVDGVAEYDRTSSEYVPIEELKAANDPRYYEQMSGVRPEGAPSIEEFRDTVVTAIEKLIAEHPRQKIAVVCHGGVINTYVGHVLGLAPSTGFFYPVYTSIHRISAASTGQRSIQSLNETPHLRGTELFITTTFHT